MKKKQISNIVNPNENRLHLEMENGKPVLKNKVGDVEITISFAEKEPERNCKEACLGIITRQYLDSIK